MALTLSVIDGTQSVAFSLGHQLDLQVEFAPSDRRVVCSPDPIEIYASAIDTSDYAERVAALIKRVAPVVGDLLDVGAGAGQLGSALRGAGRWTAIEPNPNMRARLARLPFPPRIVGCGWEAAEMPAHTYDTVLAASIAAPLQTPRAFLWRCLAWSRRRVVWVVPAQRGPRGLVFAGCLPAAWHGEDETPGVEIVLGNLPAGRPPQRVAVTDWVFSGVIADLDWLANYLADRLGWAQRDPRRGAAAAHLRHQAKPHPDGYRLEIPRKSAVLIWGES